MPYVFYDQDGALGRLELADDLDTIEGAAFWGHGWNEARPLLDVDFAHKAVRISRQQAAEMIAELNGKPEQLDEPTQASKDKPQAQPSEQAEEAKQAPPEEAPEPSGSMTEAEIRAAGMMIEVPFESGVGKNLRYAPGISKVPHAGVPAEIREQMKRWEAHKAEQQAQPAAGESPEPGAAQAEPERTGDQLQEGPRPAGEGDPSHTTPTAKDAGKRRRSGLRKATGPDALRPGEGIVQFGGRPVGKPRSSSRSSPTPYREQLTALVAEVIASSDHDTAVVTAGPATYVQFALFDGRRGIHVEAVDRDRWRSGHMTAEQVERLAALGFERGEANFVRELAVDSETPAIVGELLARALGEAYDVEPGAELEVGLIRSEEMGS